MVQLQSTVMVQIISSSGQSSRPGDEDLQVEVRAYVDNGKMKAACQTIANSRADGQCILGMRAAVQTRREGLQPEKMLGTRIDRYL